MGGGLMQLVAYGAQDIYLTGNPQITFFKVVYRRHTNFSMECIQQTLNGTTAANGRQTCTISRNGDLVHSCYIAIKQVLADPSVTTLATKDSHTAGGNGAIYDLVESVEVELMLKYKFKTCVGCSFYSKKLWFNGINSFLLKRTNGTVRL